MADDLPFVHSTLPAGPGNPYGMTPEIAEKIRNEIDRLKEENKTSPYSTGNNGLIKDYESILEDYNKGIDRLLNDWLDENPGRKPQDWLDHWDLKFQEGPIPSQVGSVDVNGDGLCGTLTDIAITEAMVDRWTAAGDFYTSQVFDPYSGGMVSAPTADLDLSPGGAGWGGFAATSWSDFCASQGLSVTSGLSLDADNIGSLSGDFAGSGGFSYSEGTASFSGGWSDSLTDAAPGSDPNDTGGDGYGGGYDGGYGGGYGGVAGGDNIGDSDDSSSDHASNDSGGGYGGPGPSGGGAGGAGYGGEDRDNFSGGYGGGYGAIAAVEASTNYARAA